VCFMCFMIIQKQTAGTLAFAPPLFSSAGAKHQRSFNGLVLSESASASYCTSATSPVIMATLLVHAAARGWSGTGTDRVLQKPLLLAYHRRRVRSKCLRAQVLKSHFWHSSATTSNRQLATAPTHALLHHRLLPPFLSGLLQAKNSSQEQQLRLMQAS